LRLGRGNGTSPATVLHRVWEAGLLPRVLFTAADWNDEERRIAFAQIMRLESRTVDSTTCLYWIDVKDEQGVGQLFTTVDWNDDDRRIAVSQICRLAGVPDETCFTEAPKKN
jgi:hypothetical protein